MKTRYLSLLALLFGALESLPGQAVEDGWVTVTPREFQGAINNPLKGFRDYKRDGFGLIRRQYVRWNDIELSSEDSVERIIAYTNRVTTINGRRFEDLNVKLVPRVYLDWDSSEGKQYWPADLHMFDYDSPAFQERLRKLVAKLGQAWDDDPRIFAIQMGLIGKWGEHHSPAPTVAQRRMLTGIFQQAFRNKPVLVRHTNGEFMAGGFGIYYDTFGTLEREPPQGPPSQFPMATAVYPEIWKRSAIEGEVEYNWQRDRASAKPLETFGLTPNETMTVPAYRRYMLDKIRKYHASYLGWISDYTDTNPDVLAGAGELQKAFGYRFVLDEARYPATVAPGGSLGLKLTVRNTGSAPFYLDWPLGVALLDPATRKPVWSAPVEAVDIREWMPGEDWDSAEFAYRRPAVPHHSEGHAALPEDIAPGAYILAVTILDRQGGLVPSARFAIDNYIRGGWHPLGFIGVGGPPPMEMTLSNIQFDSPAFDDSLKYQVPAALRNIAVPPTPPITPVTRWMPDPGVELINPWRFWNLRTPNDDLERDTILDGPGGLRGIRVTGDYGNDSSLEYHFGVGVKLEHGPYQFKFHARGTAGQFVEFELGDDWRVVSREARFPLTEQWQEHTILFEAKPTTRDVTTLRFRLARSTKGTFDLSNMRLKMLR